MPNKAAGWENTCERYVAFLDIMGFKDMVFRESHEEVKKKLESLLRTKKFIEESRGRKIMHLLNKSTDNYDAVSFPSVAFPVAFSDSIIIISWDDTDFSLAFLFAYTLLIFKKAIQEGIPMKGAIACGEMTANIEQSLFFGKPLIDAVEMQKELKLYGVVLHHTCEKRLRELVTINFEYNDIFKYKVPMKFGNVNHYIADWTSQFEDKKEALKLVNKLYLSVSGKPRLYVDNTLDFIRWVKEKKAGS